MTEQDKFHYSLPEDDGSSRWGGLSESAREAVVGRVAEPNQAEALLGEEHVDALEWARPRLSKALKKWQKYDTAVGVPGSVDELAEGHVDYEGTMTRLFEAQTALNESGKRAAIGSRTPLGETFGLVLIPWRSLRKEAHQLDRYMEVLRAFQDKNADDYWRADTLAALRDPIYRHPENPAALLTTEQYADYMLNRDGAWGIMLAQTGADIGVRQERSGSVAADILTSKHGRADNTVGKYHYAVAEQNVDGMGILEWLSLSLQKNPRKLGKKETLLLANRSEPVGGDRFGSVLVAGWDAMDEEIDISVWSAGEAEYYPRLAVL